MRRGVLVIVAALVFTLAAPGFAAVEFEGKLGSELKVWKNDVTDEWEVKADTGIELETAINAGGGNPVKAVVQLKPWELYSGLDDDGEPAGFDEDGNPIGDFDRPEDSVKTTPELIVDKAWLETEGAYWDGGPVVTTRIGDVHIAWDNYISYLDDRAGVTIDGLRVGPVTASAFYAWDQNKRPMGLSASALIEGIDVTGRVIHREGEQNYSLAAGMDVMDGVRASGLVVLDGDQRHLYRVQADADNVIEGVKLMAAYRGADDNFDPMYTRTKDDDDNELYDTLTGLTVGLETFQAGIDIKAGYDVPKKETQLSAATIIEGFTLAGSTKLIGTELDEAYVRVGRMIGDFDVLGEYEAEVNDNDELEHLVRVSTRTDMVPYLTGLGLSAEVKRVGTVTTWATGADYDAPNGLSLGAEYDSEEGPSATAGVTVKF